MRSSRIERTKLEGWPSGLWRWFRKPMGVKPAQVRILYPPPVGKRSVWLARYAGSPPDFERKIEFFVFVPPKAKRQKRAFLN